MKSWITSEFARMDHCLENMVPSDLRVLVAERDAYRQKLSEVGVCPDCLEISKMDGEGPFSHCKCGTGEDYAKRPLQKLQLKDREDADSLFEIITRDESGAIACISNHNKDGELKEVLVEFSKIKHGDLMTVNEFIDCVQCGVFIDDDGIGDLSTHNRSSSVSISPSEVNGYDWPKWATHVCWYNK